MSILTCASTHVAEKDAVARGGFARKRKGELTCRAHVTHEEIPKVSTSSDNAIKRFRVDVPACMHLFWLTVC